MPAMVPPNGKGKRIRYALLGKPGYMDSKNWKHCEKIREKIEQDSYRKIK